MSQRTRFALRAQARKYLDIDDVIQYVMAITVQGSHTLASTVTIQANTPEGKPLNKVNYLRVRVTNAFQGVQSTTVTAAGTGYTSVPTVTFAAAPAGGRTATGIAVLSTTTVGSILITDPGAGYLVAPAITITGGGGASATATSTLATTLATATNATIAAGTGTAVADTISSTKDLTFQSSATGLFTLTCTDATAEAFMLWLTEGLGMGVADTSPTLTIVHQ